jgi:hypothetical protein
MTKRRICVMSILLTSIVWVAGYVQIQRWTSERLPRAREMFVLAKDFSTLVVSNPGEFTLYDLMLSLNSQWFCYVDTIGPDESISLKPDDFISKGEPFTSPGSFETQYVLRILYGIRKEKYSSVRLSDLKIR